MKAGSYTFKSNEGEKNKNDIGNFIHHWRNLFNENPAYTSIKGVIIESGGNIGLAVAIAMGLIALTFLGGVTLLRKA